LIIIKKEHGSFDEVEKENYKFGICTTKESAQKEIMELMLDFSRHL
jgi:hypothetical protein